MATKKISIGIVLYKGEKYLQECISSLLSQSYQNFELLLRDQGQEHEALAYIEENFPEILDDSRVRVFRGGNLWHSGGHNKLIGEMAEDSEAYVCASNDMLYEKNFLENLVNNMDINMHPENSQFSVLVPKLKRWDFSEKNSENSGKTNFLDSCGIALSKNHHFVDRGQVEEDKNQYPSGEILGGSGALFLIQKTAINQIKNSETGEVFDEEIHYKNDVDLAYRLQWAGIKTLFVAESVAYHDRQVGEKNTAPKSLWVKESSFYGQMVVLYKNFWRRNFSFFLNIRVFLRMFLISVFYLFTAPKVLLQYKKFWKNLEKIQKKKKEMRIQNSPENIQKFFV